MAKISLNEITFVNFKGFRNESFKFNGDNANVYGANGSGKTTIFDGFTWLLFGKDSQDRKQFEIKTLDKNGNAIPKLTHEVRAIINVGGKDIELCRRYNEKWVKGRGCVEEEFKGHEEERLYNNVPLTVKEWNDKINAICGEQVFKMLTNPKYFTSLKAEAQRAVLVEMAQLKNDAELAKGNAEFEKLISDIKGKTFDEYKRELKAQRKRIADSVSTLPIRMEELNNTITTLKGGSESEDVVSFKLNDLQNKLDKVNAILSDSVKFEENVQREISEKIQQKNELTQNINRLIDNRARELEREFDQKCKEFETLQRSYRNTKEEIESVKAELGYQNELLENLNDDRKDLLDEYNKIQSNKLVFSGSDFVCPVCKRPLDVADIESKQAEMERNFNANQTLLLNACKNKGEVVRAKIDERTAEIEALKAKLNKLYNEITLLEYEYLNHELYWQELDYDFSEMYEQAKEEIMKSSVYEEAKKESKNLQAEIDNLSTQTTSEKINEYKTLQTTLQGEISELNKQLGSFSQVREFERRITQLEREYKDGQQALTDIEKIENVIFTFNRMKMRELETSVNKLFDFVEFKLFDLQVNGQEAEICEASVNGVPYSNLNNAMQINAGLDIIGAFQRWQKMNAPIFVDNAESVNEVKPTEAQMIRLYVSEDKRLVIR